MPSSPFRRKTNEEWADGPDGAWVDADGNSLREPPITADWRLRADLTYLLIYVAIIPAVLGAVSVVFGNFSAGMFWLLGSGAIAGLAAGARLPLRDRRYSDPELGVSPPFRGLIVAAIVYVGSVLVSLYLVAVVGALTLPHFDSSIWGMAPLYWLMIVLGGGAGVLVGILGISPTWDVVMQRRHNKEGGVPVVSVMLSVTFLLLLGSAVAFFVGVRPAGWQLVSRGLGLGQAIEVFFGVHGFGNDYVIVAEPAVWIFRVLILAVVVCATIAAHAGTRRWAARTPVAAQPGEEPAP